MLELSDPTISVIENAKLLYKKASKQRRAGAQLEPLIEAAEEQLIYLEEVAESLKELDRCDGACLLVSAAQCCMRQFVAGSSRQDPLAPPWHPAIDRRQGSATEACLWAASGAKNACSVPFQQTSSLSSYEVGGWTGRWVPKLEPVLPVSWRGPAQHPRPCAPAKDMSIAVARVPPGTLGLSLVEDVCL